MTRVSRFLPSIHGSRLRSRLARLSHLLGGMTVALCAAQTSGCLLSPPPDHEEEPLLPPVIDVEQTLPAPYRFHEVSANDQVQFRVRVRSSTPGAGDDEFLLHFLLFRDFENFTNGDDEALRWVDTPRNVPSSFDEPYDFTKSYTFSEESDGCYQFTLFVTHVKNGTPPNLVDPSDVAHVTWWFNVETDDVDNDVRDCLMEGLQ